MDSYVTICEVVDLLIDQPVGFFFVYTPVTTVIYHQTDSTGYTLHRFARRISPPDA